ncbi:MAG: hypothetical protein ACI4XP_09695 [Acutalibacteraceae bacterium]
MEIYVVKTDKCYAFDYDYDNSEQESSYYVSEEKAIKVFNDLVERQVGNRMWYPYCEDDYEQDGATFEGYETDRKARLEKDISKFLSRQSNSAYEMFLPDFGREYYTVTIKRVTVIE